MFVVDDIVERTAREVSEKYGLTVCAWPHAVDGVGQGTVAIVGETGGNRTDVHKEVGFHHNESRSDAVAVGMAVEQVELHPLGKKSPKVGIVETVAAVGAVHFELLSATVVVGGYIYKGVVPVVHDAAQACHIGQRDLFHRAVVRRKHDKQSSRHINGKHR